MHNTYITGSIRFFMCSSVILLVSPQCAHEQIWLVKGSHSMSDDCTQFWCGNVLKTTKGKYIISTIDIRTCVAKILFWMSLSCSWIKDMKSVLAIFNSKKKNTERASYLQRCNNKHQTCLFEVPQILGCWDSVRDFRLWPPSSNPLMAVCAMRMGCHPTP